MRPLRWLALGYCLVVMTAVTACGNQPASTQAGSGATPTTSASPCADSNFDAVGLRTRDVIATTVRALLADSMSKGDSRKVVYFTDHGVPAEPGPEPDASAQPGTASSSKERFAEPVLKCLASGELEGLPKMTIVTGHDDPKIPREKPDGFSRMTDGRVVAVSAVPAAGDSVRMSVSSGGGGGLDHFGAVHLVERQPDGSWKVTKTLTQFMA